MSCQTRFLPGLVVDGYDSMGSQGDKLVRPSPFGLRIDIAASIGLDQNLDRLSIETGKMLYLAMKNRWWLIQAILVMCGDSVLRHGCLGLHGNFTFSDMFWYCITYQRFWTFTEVEGNINSRKYVNILDTYLWSVIARHFPTVEFLFQDCNAPYMLLRRQHGGSRKPILNVWYGPLNHRTLA